ncbi:DNA segregation ATPase FtsK/SpoIIIE, S-DNA-T family [Jatrophihabitans endophyticus]|uniref:DNA segregation ATPase FtsK/SpoIIIE, S-DNA-T family n=1 Tax=Jatrophihabitans endophyticus TaxID=1206085 RepID=A0A1M5EWJ4_9ACTN|nr:FtsK/SpoIIIE domain-containing protein [Jatrophihabitans endophyticus]SHF83613.1 DNA segregation ATPase FtsK/SpoIIIE, S-DNA-T family [Jatrophihabitans endophyticus]
MRTELTVSGPAGERDVAVVSAGQVTLAEVLPALRAAAGADDGAIPRARVRSTAGSTVRPLEGRTPLGSLELPAGSLVAFHALPAPRATGLLELRVVGGATTGEPVPLRRGTLTVGRGSECDVVLDDDQASRRHASLVVGGGAVQVTDLSSTNGTAVDGVDVGPEGRAVPPGALVRVGNSLLCVGDLGGQRSATLSAAPDGGVVVHRPPRARAEAPGAVIDLPVAGYAARPAHVQWVAAVVPALAGAAMAWAFATPQFLLFALLSPVVMLSGALGDRLHWRRSRRRTDASHRRRVAAAAAEVAARLAAEVAARRTANPDPATVGWLAHLPGSRLWERRRTDADHLAVRVGTADLPSLLQVRDEREDGPMPHREPRPAGTASLVPVVVPLRAGPLAVVGPAADVAGSMRWLVGQLATLHSPADLEIVLLTGPGREAGWRWARWLPHVRSQPATDAAAATATLARLAARERDATRRQGELPAPWAGPWTVLVIDDPAGVGTTDLAAVLADGARRGVTAIWAVDGHTALPDCCRTAIVAGGSRLAVQSWAAGGLSVTDAIADRVSAPWSIELARSLASLVDGRRVGVPERCRLGDLLGTADSRSSPDDVLAAWSASDGRPRAVLGMSRDGPVTVDLAADGPHALVAGTTGSGKSELLRTLVLSLAVAHPPTAVTFLLVDYKGGATFADCAGLPHTTGLVTDLDQRSTVRALRSLQAELRRREQLLSAAGADDLDAYRRCRGGEPLPRLVVVVDEFAELAGELPDFVSGLVGVARRGRSLGVHLILATQRPGSAVTAEIRANTALRIALRVTDADESLDVVDVGDAALLDPRQPGRCYLRTGTSLRQVQTATVRAAPSATPVVELLDGWRRPGAGDEQQDGEIGSLVELLRRSAARGAFPPARAPWLPPLPDRLALTDVADPVAAPAFAIGRVDHPDDQSQPNLTVDPAHDDTVLVVGRARSGRTGALLTIAVAACRAAPAQVQVHVVDGSGTLTAALSALPQLGTAVTRHCAAMTPVLLDRLDAQHGPGANEREAPRSLLLIDDWDRLLAERDDAEAARWSAALSRLLRSTGPRLTVVVAGGRELLLPRFAAPFGQRLVLALTDPVDYALAGVPAGALPADPPPGRGVRGGDGATFQLAHPGPTPGLDGDRAAVAELARRPPPGERRDRLRLRPLPTRVSLAQLRAQLATDAAGTAGARPGNGPPTGPGYLLGVGGDEALPCAVDVLGHRARLLVAGPPRSGRSTLLLTLLEEGRRAGHDVAVLAPPRSPVAAAARRYGARLLAPADPASLGPAPGRPALLLVDDAETWLDTPIDEALCRWLRSDATPLAAAVAGRSHELAATFRGVAAQVRRERCGVLLHPGPIDAELLGLHRNQFARADTGDPPGRGLLVGDPAWGPLFTAPAGVAVQVADPEIAPKVPA